MQWAEGRRFDPRWRSFFKYLRGKIVYLLNLCGLQRKEPPVCAIQDGICFFTCLLFFCSLVFFHFCFSFPFLIFFRYTYPDLQNKTTIKVTFSFSLFSSVFFFFFFFHLLLFVSIPSFSIFFSISVLLFDLLILLLSFFSFYLL